MFAHSHLVSPILPFLLSDPDNPTGLEGAGHGLFANHHLRLSDEIVQFPRQKRSVAPGRRTSVWRLP